VTTAAADPATAAHAQRSALAGVLDRSRLQVLRATVLIGLLVACSNLAGATPSGRVQGPATLLGSIWCVLWLVAATFPMITARCLLRWRVTALALAGANAATVALTGGIDSPLLSVCMYGGWIASVVVNARGAMGISLTIAASVFAGYLLAGASPADVLTGAHRDSALNSALLPILTGLVGVMLAGVTNSIFGRIPEIVDGLRHGAPASTPAMTALLAGHPIALLPPGPRERRAVPGRVALTSAEREVVALLADGLRPKQIARLRGVAISTVRSQIAAAKKKTGARTIEELIAITWEDGG
jgi:DNA-binding CsgD family transcriptional regulator